MGTSKNLQDEKPMVGVRGRRAVVSPELARELCTCGHRASSHAVLKYSCQAPGDHKGYCPCMRFISAKEWRGNKVRGSYPILMANKSWGTSQTKQVPSLCTPAARPR